MTGTAKARTCQTPAARQKRVWDKTAPGYDRQIAFFERIWFAGGREWLGERARGRVLGPGGRLLLLDDIGSIWPPVYAAQWLVERSCRLALVSAFSTSPGVPASAKMKPRY
jgi:hypothetical protein